MIRKSLVIWASVTLALGAETLALSAAPRQYESYDYAEPAKQLCMVIPKGLNTVRGILVVCNYMGGDSRDYSTYDKPLTITSPLSGMPGGAQYCNAGSDVPIIVDASQFPSWKKLAFYDGAHGNLRTSNPALVVVRSPQR